jgi:hypothetical protein
MGLAIGIVSGLSGLFGAFVLLPYRIDAAEQEIRQIKTEARIDHELLVRIDERSKRIEERIEELRR